MTLPDGWSYTITGFATGAYAGDTCSSAAGRRSTGSLVGKVAVSDYLAVTSTFTLSSNGILLANGQAWQSLGFAVGDEVYMPGYGVRTIERLRERRVDQPGRRDAARRRDPDRQRARVHCPPSLTGTISVTSRNRVSDTLTLTGTTDGGTVVLATKTVLGTGLAVGQQVRVTGVTNGVRTIVGISSDGKTITLSGGAIPTVGPTSGAVALVRVGGDTITLTGASFAGSLDTTATTITRSSGSWIDDGFAAGRQVILGGDLGGVFDVIDVTDTVADA